jgi:hypothetical protein
VKKRVNFWSPEAIELLSAADRKDVVDKGDALAERVSALITSAVSRLEDYIRNGDLYCGRGGSDLVGAPEAVAAMDEFVNVRLKAEIKALEQLLSVFDDLRDRPGPPAQLPLWY